MSQRNRSQSPRQVRFREHHVRNSSHSSQNSGPDIGSHSTAGNHDSRKQYARYPEDSNSFYNRRTIRESPDCRDVTDHCNEDGRTSRNSRDKIYTAVKKNNSTDDAASDHSHRSYTNLAPLNKNSNRPEIVRLLSPRPTKQSDPQRNSRTSQSYTESKHRDGESSRLSPETKRRQYKNSSDYGPRSPESRHRYCEDHLGKRHRFPESRQRACANDAVRRGFKNCADHHRSCRQSESRHGARQNLLTVQQRHQSTHRDQSPDRTPANTNSTYSRSSQDKQRTHLRTRSDCRAGRSECSTGDRYTEAQHNAALVIQRNFRSFSGKVHYQELQYVAGTLQRFIRGYLIRKQMEQMNAAATTVQRSFRNYRCMRGTQPRRRIIRASLDSLLDEFGSTVLIVGGVDIFEPRRYRPIPTGDILRYNSFRNEWQYVGITPDRRRHATATYLNGKVYVVGGVQYCDQTRRSHALSSMWILDPVNAEWTRGPDMYHARVFHAAVVYLGELYILGGQDNSGCTLSSVETYCPRRDSWQCAPDLPHPRAGLAAALFQHKIWVAGGMCVEGKCPVSTTVSLYDPFGKKWSDGFPLRRSCCHGRLVVAADKLFLVGGLGRSERQVSIDSVNRVEVWQQRQRVWSCAARLATARHRHALVQYGADEFLVVGGDNAEMSALDSVEHFSNRLGEFLPTSATLPGRFLGIAAVFIPAAKLTVGQRHRK